MQLCYVRQLPIVYQDVNPRICAGLKLTTGQPFNIYVTRVCLCRIFSACFILSVYIVLPCAVLYKGTVKAAWLVSEMVLNRFVWCVSCFYLLQICRLSFYSFPSPFILSLNLTLETSWQIIVYTFTLNLLRDWSARLMFAWNNWLSFVWNNY